MARIRTIKPEFWDSPSTAKAGPWARLAFIAMWNWADDFGRGTANLKELEGFIFPFDESFTDSSGNTVHFRDVVAEVAECFGVVFYEVDGRPYFAIPTWEKHQRNERRAKESKYPGPDDNAALTTEYGRSTEMHGISATDGRRSTEAPRSSGTGTGEQGNRGTGEQSPLTPAIIEDSVDNLPAVVGDGFDEWWDTYDKKVSRKNAERRYRLALKKPGVTADLLLRSAAAYIQHQKAIGKHPEFTKNPETWLNGEHWNDDLVQRAPAARFNQPRTAASMTDDDWAAWMADAAAKDAADQARRSA